MAHEGVVDANNEAHLKKAARILSEGGVVAFPTETVYGLGADAFNEKAVCRIFEIKKRPSFDPLIVHVSDFAQVSLLWQEVPPLAEKLMRRFWPGPLTIVLPKKKEVPDVVTAGLGTVAVRMPQHDSALKLIGFLGRPVAAPSANIFGYTSPTTAQAVSDDLGEQVDLILDGGPTRIGVESTVIKIDKDRCYLLRPGGISLEQLAEFTPVLPQGPESGSAPESPGLLDSHYAPWTRFVLFEGTLQALVEKMKGFKTPTPRIGLLSFYEKTDSSFFESVEILSEKKDLVEAASKLFEAMRKLDKMHLDLIVALPVPRLGIGCAIMDRLEKASGSKSLDDFLENWKQ